jgi:hypothetical protein
MADIEAAAMPIVGPMVINQPMDLDANAQQIVANWVALKVLVAAHASNLDEWIPESHYRQVHNAQGAPANTMRVWVGHRWNLADHQPGRAHIFDFYFMPVADHHLGQAPLPPDVQRYRQEGGVFNGTIFQVGHFFALAFQHDWPGLRMHPTPGSEAVAALPPIWPIGPTVHWPPPKPVDDLGNLHGDQVPSDRPAVGSSLRPVDHLPGARKRLLNRRAPRVPLFTVCHNGAKEGISGAPDLEAAHSLRTGSRSIRGRTAPLNAAPDALARRRPAPWHPDCGH